VAHHQQHEVLLEPVGVVEVAAGREQGGRSLAR